MQYDPSKRTTDDLLSRYRFHLNDIGCTTVEAECRRMHLVDVIGAELERRGVSLPEPSYADRDEDDDH